MGQEQNSCDTTQIDPRSSRASTRSLHTVIYSPWVTGGFPSVATKAEACSDRPQKSIHRTLPRRTLTIHGSLGQKLTPDYYSFSKVFSLTGCIIEDRMLFVKRDGSCFFRKRLLHREKPFSVSLYFSVLYLSSRALYSLLSMIPASKKSSSCFFQWV